MVHNGRRFLVLGAGLLGLLAAASVVFLDHVPSNSGGQERHAQSAPLRTVEPAGDDAKPPQGISREQVPPPDGGVSQAEPRREGDDALAPPPTVARPQIVEELERNPAFSSISSLERLFASEIRDPAWSVPMENRILSEVSQKALGMAITDVRVDCQSTVCRLQIGFPKELVTRDFGVVPRDTPWNGQQPVSFFINALDLDIQPGRWFASLDGYGTPIMVAYVLKPSEPVAEQP